MAQGAALRCYEPSAIDSFYILMQILGVTSLRYPRDTIRWVLKPNVGYKAKVSVGTLTEYKIEDEGC